PLLTSCWPTFGGQCRELLRISGEGEKLLLHAIDVGAFRIAWRISRCPVEEPDIVQRFCCFSRCFTRQAGLSRNLRVGPLSLFACVDCIKHFLLSAAMTQYLCPAFKVLFEV